MVLIASNCLLHIVHHASRLLTTTKENKLKAENCASLRDAIGIAKDKETNEPSTSNPSRGYNAFCVKEVSASSEKNRIFRD